MLRVSASYLERVAAAESAGDLHALVADAIKLEFSTIPPYLTALLSLHPGRNGGIRETIHGVVVDEMLHMTIGCNILNALGGRPRIGEPDFLPAYPGPLPMSIGDGLVVGLEPFSTDLARRVFMEIEEPETPIPIPVLARAAELQTIGAFYAMLAEKLESLGDAAFTGDPTRQVVPAAWFGQRAFPIRGVADALRAVRLVVEEGEGTAASPLDPDGEMAHYYRFEEIWRLRRVARDDSVAAGYSFSGPVVPFDADAVWPITPNQKLAELDGDSQAGRRASQFTFVFTKLMRALGQTFDGAPDMFDSAMGLMFELKLAGQKLVELPAVLNGAPTGLNAGPVFEYSQVPR